MELSRIDLENDLKESIESHLISLHNEFQRYFLDIMTENFIWKLGSLQRHPRVLWSRFDSWRHALHRSSCPPLFTDLGLEGGGCSSPFLDNTS
jgi:hypothetical protein